MTHRTTTPAAFPRTPVDAADLIDAVRSLLRGHETPTGIVDRAELLDDVCAVAAALVAVRAEAAQVNEERRLDGKGPRFAEHHLDALEHLAARLLNQGPHLLHEIGCMEAETVAAEVRQ